nr:zinc finger, CCHC-type [Tanacetum cinerariifolium]
LSQGFWGEAMFCYLLNRVPNLNYLIVGGCKVVVRLPDLKLKTLVSVNSIIKSRDAIFDANRLSSVHRPSLRITNGTEDIGGSVVLEEVDGTIEKFKARQVIQEFRQKSGIDYFDTYAPVARISTIRLLIAMASIHNLIIHPVDVKTTFLNGKLDDEVYMNKPHGFIVFGNENKVDMTKEFLSFKFSMKDIEEADVILGIGIKHESNGIETYQSYYIEKAVSQREYSRVIGCLMYVITYTRPDIAFAVAAGKEVEWLRILIFKIPLWSKPIAHISVLYDSAATLAKAYSQMYNVKSRHLGFRHNMIHELITNGGGIYRGCKVSTKLS